MRQAASALERGDALAALNLVGRESSALGLLLRGIAYAQLGDLELASSALEAAVAGAEPLMAARARAALVELALRCGEPEAAGDAARASVHALSALGDLASLEHELSLPIARVLRAGRLGDADLASIEQLQRREVLLVDACRLVVVAGRATIPLSRRPVLFALLDTLARAYPSAVPREELARRAFDVRRVNASHRARLRVEVGRLRSAIADLAAHPEATAEGYALRSTRQVVSLFPLSDDDGARLTLLLGDGAAWSAQGLAEHAGVSRRTAQRALAALVERGQALRIGTGRQVRYQRPGTPLASRMLLLSLLPKP